jgi:DNA topoisomerase-1
MAPAVFFSITASISAFQDTKFTYTSELIDFPGWKIVSKKYVNEIKPENKEYQYLQQIKQNTEIKYKKMCAKVTIKGSKQHYTEARLVQLLEEKGIGRPSTFSSLVDKIQERGYVKKEDVKGKELLCKDYELSNGDIFEIENKREFGNEKGKLVIQPLGIIVMEFIDKHFSGLFNYSYTKEMEDELDKIAKGHAIWYNLCETCNKQIDTLVDGLKNSQKIRVIIDGFGIYTTVGNIFNVYAHHSLKQAAFDGLFRLSSDRYFAKRANKEMPTGIGMTSYNTTQIGKQVQIDLI